MKPPSGPLLPAAAPGELQRVLYRERMRVLFSHTSTTSLISGVFAFVLAYVLLGAVHPGHLAIWLVVKTATQVPRMIQWWRYRRTAEPHAQGWRAGFIALLGLDGAAWGLGCAWLMPAGNLTVNAVIVATLLGVCAVSSVVLEADLVAHAVFVAGLLLPPALFLLTQHDPYSLYGGVGVLSLMAVMFHEGRRAQRRFTELVTLRHATQVIAEERAAALQQAEQSNAFKSRFLAQLSHELRTPLHGILGLSRMVREREANEQSKEQLRLLERSGRHLLGVINDVLDLSKIEAGRLKMSCEPFDLSRLVDDVVALSGVSATHKGLELRCENKLARPCWVAGDAARVRQVLLNLVGNAIKFTDAGQVTLRVTADRVHRENICLLVKDTGTGMTPADQQCIFEAFRQLDNGRGRIPGTGLGLTISRELARAMGGDVSCHSVLGQGSEFTFTVKLPPAEAPADAAERAGPEDLAPRPLQGHVLLAEDNPVNALVAQAHLAELGLQVSTVADGQAAVDFVRTSVPDLILMDCQMPVLDGFQATQDIRRLEAQQGREPTPIIALTANALESDRERCLASGMDDHLAKPFDQTELRRMLQRHLPLVIRPGDDAGPRVRVADSDTGPVTV